MNAIEFAFVALAIYGFTEWTRHDHRIKALFARLEQTRFKWITPAYDCGFCWSFWTTLICGGLCLVPYGKVLLLFFALRAAANLLSDITQRYNKSPNKRPRETNHERNE